MIVNPFTTHLPTIPGTRMLADAMGFPGYSVVDPREPWRLWTVQWLYAPIDRRALGGVRFRLLDQGGFVTFCNQRDLELLFGYASPGQSCQWTRGKYPAPDDREWVGFCMDREDSLDDLLERELSMRNGSMQILQAPRELVRKVHIEEKVDAEELFTLIGDRDRKTGVSPDYKLETIESRWSRVQKVPLSWGQ